MSDRAVFVLNHELFSKAECIAQPTDCDWSIPIEQSWDIADLEVCNLTGPAIRG